MKSSLTENPDLDTYLPICCVPLIRMIRIVLFQIVAAMIVTFGTMVSYGEVYSQCAFISLAMFYAFVISGQLSGGQGNPIITIALMFTRGSNVTVLNSLLYFPAQFAGAFAGGALALWTVSAYGVQVPTGKESAPLTFGNEILGSFLFVILYLIIMSGSTKMQNNFWCYMLVPIAFYLSKMVSDTYTSLNPVAVLANQVFFGAKYGDWGPLNIYWVYIVGPFVGATAAAAIFNFFLLPVHVIYNRRK